MKNYLLLEITDTWYNNLYVPAVYKRILFLYEEAKKEWKNVMIVEVIKSVN